MHCVIFLFFAFYIQFSPSSGGTIFDRAYTIEEHGHPVHYCSWKGTRYLPNTDFKDYEQCVHCTCSKKYLTCNSLVENVFISSKDDELSECKAVKIACDIKWVLKKNMDVLCPQHKIPKHQATL